MRQTHSRWRPSRPNSEFLHWQWRQSPSEEMLTNSGTDWFSRRGGTCRLHANIYEPTVYLYGESGRNCQAPGKAAEEKLDRATVEFMIVNGGKTPHAAPPPNFDHGENLASRRSGIRRSEEFIHDCALRRVQRDGARRTHGRKTPRPRPRTCEGCSGPVR